MATHASPIYPIRPQQPATLPVGTEVYYTGNRCNPGTFGTVKEHKGYNVGIACDEYGMLWLPQAMLAPCTDNNSGHGSCLFLASEYRAVIEAKMAALGFKVSKEVRS